jgi:dCTP diphosphatase
MALFGSFLSRCFDVGLRPTSARCLNDRLTGCSPLLNICLPWDFQGKAGKYTEYSDATGITKDHGQTTSVGSASRVTSEKNDGDDNDDDDNPCDVRVVQRLTEAIRDFAMERQWSSYHRPRNLVLALLGELGELAELVQWNGDRDQPLARDQLDKLSQELADVAIYLLRLADVCGVQVTLTVAEGM